LHSLARVAGVIMRTAPASVQSQCRSIGSPGLVSYFSDAPAAPASAPAAHNRMGKSASTPTIRSSPRSGGLGGVKMCVCRASARLGRERRHLQSLEWEVAERFRRKIEEAEVQDPQTQLLLRAAQSAELGVARKLAENEAARSKLQDKMDTLQMLKDKWVAQQQALLDLATHLDESEKDLRVHEDKLQPARIQAQRVNSIFDALGVPNPCTSPRLAPRRPPRRNSPLHMHTCRVFAEASTNPYARRRKDELAGTQALREELDSQLSSDLQLSLSKLTSTPMSRSVSARSVLKSTPQSQSRILETCPEAADAVYDVRSPQLVMDSSRSADLSMSPQIQPRLTKGAASASVPVLQPLSTKGRACQLSPRKFRLPLKLAGDFLQSAEQRSLQSRTAMSSRESLARDDPTLKSSAGSASTICGPPLSPVEEPDPGSANHPVSHAKTVYLLGKLIAAAEVELRRKKQLVDELVSHVKRSKLAEQRGRSGWGPLLSSPRRLSPRGSEPPLSSRKLRWALDTLDGSGPQ